MYVNWTQRKYVVFRAVNDGGHLAAALALGDWGTAGGRVTMLLVFCGGGHSPVPPLLSLTAGEEELNDRSYRGTVRAIK